MKARSVQGETLAASLVIATACVLATAALGYATLGLGVASGLLAGSANGFLVRALLERRAPILPTSLVRLAFFSLLALVAARILGVSAWSVIAGFATSQLVMAAVGVRQGLRS